jgi:hypothetical protein
MLAKGPRLVPRAANFETDQVVIKVGNILRVGNLTAEVPGTKNVARRNDSRWRRI